MKREVYKTFRVNEEEDKIIREKAERCNLSQAALIRMLVMGFIPGEAPPDKFYEKMDELNREGVKFERLVAKLNTLGFTEQEELNKIIDRIGEIAWEIRRDILQNNDDSEEE